MPVSRRALLLAGGALVAAAVGVFGASVAFAGDEVPRGTMVRTLELGGLSRAEAVTALSGAFGTERTSPIALVADEQVLTLDPVRAGLELDVEATVDEALDVGPLDRLKLLVGGGRDVDPVPSVDEAALQAELEALAGGFDRPPREGSIAFSDEGKAVESMPETGRRLDVDETAEAVEEAYLSQRVDGVADVTPVATSEQDVRDAVQDIAVPALAAPIAVTGGDGRVSVEALDLAATMTIVTDDQGELGPVIDAPALHARLLERLKDLGQAPVDASFVIEAGRPVVVPSQDGTSISPPDLAAAVSSVLTDPAPRTAAAPLTPQAPRVTTAMAKGLGIVEQLATYTSEHPCCQPRVTNIHRIADIIDGYVLKPGEQLDLNAVVGRRDTARGFVPAPQILDGEFVDSVGGGVSQFTTALFNTVFFSGLKDVEHSPHSYYISRYPPGRESTVSFPKPDFIFENDTPNGVLVKTAYTGTSITVTFWGTKQYDEVRSVTGPRTRVRDFETVYDERSTCSSTSGGLGFDIVVTRVFVKGGAEVRREDFSTRYRPQPRIVCGPPPAPPAPPSPSPVPSPSPSLSPAAEPPAPT